MIYVIANPVAGHGNGKIYADKCVEFLKSENKEFKIYFSGARGECIGIAKRVSEEKDCEMVVAIGGDGTFNEVMSSLDLSIPVAFVPAGTGNDFVRGADLPFNPEEAIKNIVHGAPRSCDIMSVNGRRCINVAGTGFDVEVLAFEKKIRKYLPAGICYMFALIKSLLWFSFTNVTLSVDGGEKRTLPVLLIAIANGKYYGGGMPISLDSSCDDGILDLVIIKKLPRYKIPMLFIRFFQGKLTTLTKYVEVIKCKKLEFSIDKSIPVNIDGELWNNNPVTIDIIEGGFKIIK